jgi:hypothetical protein
VCSRQDSPQTKFTDILQPTLMHRTFYPRPSLSTLVRRILYPPRNSLSHAHSGTGFDETEAHFDETRIHVPGSDDNDYDADNSDYGGGCACGFPRPRSQDLLKR